MIRYEIKKIFTKTGGKIGLLVLLLTFVIVCYSAVTYTTNVDEMGEEHTGITAIRDVYEKKKPWSGMVTEEYLKSVIRENNRINAEFPYDPSDAVISDMGYSREQGFYDIKIMINSAFCEFRDYNAFRVDKLTENEVGKFYENRVQNLKNWLDSEEANDMFSEAEKDFLIERYETLETPFYYEPADGWQAAIQYVISIIMLTMIVLSFFVSGIFSNEFQWRADSIFFSTKYGRDKGTFSKIAAGLIVITVIYWAMILLFSLVVFGIYGTSGADCVIQTGPGGWKSIYHMTYLQEYLFIIGGGYVGVLFILSVSMLVSAKTHNTVIAVTIPFLILFIQSFFGGFAELRDVLGLLPDQLLELNTAVITFALYEFGGKVIPSIPILLILYPVLCLLLPPLMYVVYHKTQIK